MAIISGLAPPRESVDVSREARWKWSEPCVCVCMCVLCPLGTFSPRSLHPLSLWREPCRSCPKAVRRRSGRSSAVTYRGQGSGWAPPSACHMHNWHIEDETDGPEWSESRSNLQEEPHSERHSELRYRQANGHVEVSVAKFISPLCLTDICQIVFSCTWFYKVRNELFVM